MASEFRKRPRAEADLDAIWKFVATNNGYAADRLLDQIGEAFKLLVENPLVGRARPEFDGALRSFVVGNYVIFYGIVANAIEITRVMHCRQDISPEDLQ
ncbi:toxin ParE1/3/4 [Rhodopseudomonas rhenobacensis]|uniref:Toxin n=1 Tax=Rhodopseudomonas rhenobacensis TaxID=87461 RepID=A0A7W8DX71_9BRAD|nr:type II toxin-antitoxin system RelE/ParE family toxin [Rhodopseudomonas rhenobacensis]MBB5045500.1 toxin ParE1/3/4 [Rhodopseudomonas rhenobacensis]